ncbi:hypothetical protein FB567DRAFT_540850 [Paraphoma chrysanthemicola]|uniref:Uncharacterized protein n=1 Tax=Paraphoma chrysanthemicola TaxID=798071 RepID=A0A8K0VSE3_9PLEO|nr:hypothetical protein FB567DRAFT_540850 [Paraphoma chrysanthemicola]
MKTKYSLSASQRIIAANWLVKKTAQTTQKCLALLAILSSATSGQYLLVWDQLQAAMVFRWRNTLDQENVLKEEDVRATIEALYAAAGALGSEWPETRDDRLIGKRVEKMKGWSENKNVEKKVVRDGELREELGDEAAIAARSTKRGEMDELVGRMEKARVPDDRVQSEDQDD